MGAAVQPQYFRLFRGSAVGRDQPAGGLILARVELRQQHADGKPGAVGAQLDFVERFDGDFARAERRGIKNQEAEIWRAGKHIGRRPALRGEARIAAVLVIILSQLEADDPVAGGIASQVGECQADFGVKISIAVLIIAPERQIESHVFSEFAGSQGGFIVESDITGIDGQLDDGAVVVGMAEEIFHGFILPDLAVALGNGGNGRGGEFGNGGDI